MKRKGFTLIELLVVIAIIAILAAILFPVFLNAKERGRMAKCLGNLKNLSVAVRMYADDNGGRMPSAYYNYASPDWCGCDGAHLDSASHPIQVYPDKGAIWPYTGKNKAIFLCPSDSNLAPTKVNGGTVKDYALSYSMNWLLGLTAGKAYPPPYDRRDRAVVDNARSQSRVLLFIQETRGIDGIDDGCYKWDTRAYNVPGKVHYNGTTVSYLDGHAGWRSRNQLLRERDDPSRPWDPLQ